MATVFLLGAGASHGYDQSPSGVLPPLAGGFFEAYSNLDIATDFDVRVGSVVNHARDTYGIHPAAFGTFNADIERFMTRLDIQLRKLADMILEKKHRDAVETLGEFFQANQAYDQVILLSAHILNEIQNGPVAGVYKEFANGIEEGDTVATFNWDTLLDRAFEESGEWFPDTGYGVEFEAVLDQRWRPPRAMKSRRRIYKLHGSTNWLVHYMTRSLGDGRRGMVSRKGVSDDHVTLTFDMNFDIVAGHLVAAPQAIADRRSLVAVPSPPDLDALPVCIVDSRTSVSTYGDRWRPHYEPYSYFFPPDHPRSGIPLMPLLVPPTEFKLYEEFAHVLDPLWTLTQAAIDEADRVVVIGYSFPMTDGRALGLLRDQFQGVVEVVNPDPDPVCARISQHTSISADRILPRPATFSEYIQQL